MSKFSDVIDFGLGIGKGGKLHGNIDSNTIRCLEETRSVVGNQIVISGTGGTGLLTRVALMENILKAAYGWRIDDEEDSED